MPRDQRLYMTFPIEFPEHPKVKPLTDKAFRVFVEMNAYSRRLGLDGVIPDRVAHTTWNRKALTELTQSHTERPLVLHDQGCYILRSYDDHQMTNDDIEDLRVKRSEAGRKGGNATASARANAKQTGSKGAAELKSESESELTTDVTDVKRSGHLPDSGGRRPDQKAASLVGIEDLDAVRLMLEQTANNPVSTRGAVELASSLLSKAKGDVRKVDAYLATVCRKSPGEVQQAYFDLDIAAFGEVA